MLSKLMNKLSTMNDPEGSLEGAAYCGDVSLVKYILEHYPNIDLNSSKNYPNTPLVSALSMPVSAIERGPNVKAYVEIAKLLIQAGAHVNVLDKYGRNTLYLTENEEIATMLIERGVDMNFILVSKTKGEEPVLIHKINSGGHNTNIAGIMIDSGCDVNMTYFNGTTVLMVAISSDQREIITKLIDKGCLIDAQNSDGKTALMKAAQKHQLGIVNMLLDAGANVHHRNNENQTVLIYACIDECSIRFAENNVPQIVQRLLDAGANVDDIDDLGKSALMYAGFPEMASVLIKAGADVNRKNNKGNTALMVAAYEKNMEVVKVLFKAGAYINVTNNEGKTALDFANTEDDYYVIVPKLVEMLVKHGAKSGSDFKPTNVQHFNHQNVENDGDTAR